MAATLDGCGDGDPYFGADFPFLAANVAYKAGQPLAGDDLPMRSTSSLAARGLPSWA